MQEKKAIAAAGRLAGFIGVVKWALIGLYAICAVVSITLAANGGSETKLDSDGFIVSDAGAGLPAGAGIGAVLAATVAALGTWVLFGWFQHTLRMLALSANLALDTTVTPARQPQHWTPTPAPN